MITNLDEARFTSGLFCPKCGCTENIIKAGFDSKHRARHICKNCSTKFSSATKSFMSYSKKHEVVWRKYLVCMIKKYSIRKAAEECEISVRTSFMWRHKILDALRQAYKPELKGIVEADETFFPLSFKGRKPKDFVYPKNRKHHSRGGQCSVAGLSKEKVCVPCAFERESKTPVARIGGLGKTSSKSILDILSGKIKEKSVFCTDREKSYLKFATANNLEHIRLENTTTRKGIFHIQNVNGFHSRLKTFIQVFKGVSTKHLNNYLIWNIAINEKSSQNSEFSLLDKIWCQGLQYIGNTLYRDVCSREAVPIGM